MMGTARVVLLAALFLEVAGTAQADTVLGVPVVASGSSTQAVPNCPTLEGQSCYNPTTGAVGFYIPLRGSHGGVFGVTPHAGGTAGTYSDTGSGASSVLTMYLLFAPVNLPVSSASLTFTFVDLDLRGINDPNGFFESVRFYDASGTTITPLITTNGQSGGGSLPFVVSGNSTTQTVFFPDVTSILNNPFFVQLTFGSQSSFTGKNTIESLTGTLNYTPAPVPEPASLLLVGTGLLGIGFGHRRRK